MSLEAWVAIAGLAFTVLIAVVGGAFQMGKHSQRISALEERTKDLPAVAVLTAMIAEMKEQMREMAHDIKNLLTGRVQPARRQRDGD